MESKLSQVCCAVGLAPLVTKDILILSEDLLERRKHSIVMLLPRGLVAETVPQLFLHSWLFWILKLVFGDVYSSFNDLGMGTGDSNSL
jgi:hypothetical protein